MFLVTVERARSIQVAHELNSPYLGDICSMHHLHHIHPALHGFLLLLRIHGHHWATLPGHRAATTPILSIIGSPMLRRDAGQSAFARSAVVGCKHFTPAPSRKQETYLERPLELRATRSLLRLAG